MNSEDFRRHQEADRRLFANVNEDRLRIAEAMKAIPAKAEVKPTARVEETKSDSTVPKFSVRYFHEH